MKNTNFLLPMFASCTRGPASFSRIIGFFEVNGSRRGRRHTRRGCRHDDRRANEWLAAFMKPPIIRLARRTSDYEDTGSKRALYICVAVARGFVLLQVLEMWRRRNVGGPRKVGYVHFRLSEHPYLGLDKL